MRIKAKLVIIIAVIVILAGVFIALSLNSQPSDITDESSVDTGIEILNVENLRSISVYGTEEYKLNYNGIWSVDGKNNIKLNQTSVSMLTSTAAYLYADSVAAENVTDLSAYGLDNPSLFIELADDENNVYSIKFGMITGTQSGYYATVNNEDDVYIVPVDTYNSLNGGLASLRFKTIVEFTEAITGITISNTESMYTIQTKTTEYVNSNNLSDWEMITPYHKDVNQEIFESKIIDVIDFTISEFIDDDPSNYSKYGLDKPKYSITIYTDTTTTKILLGNDKDGSSIYMKLDNEPNVYAISKDLVKYRDYTPVYLLESFAFIRNIIATDNIVFNAGNEYVLKIDDSGFYANGKKVDENLFRSAFESIISPVISGEAEAGVGKELCRFTFNYNTNTPSETVIYYEYGDMYAAASIDGKIDFYVKRTYIDNMINAVKNLAE